MKKGYLEDDDYSAWLDDDNMTLTVIDTRYKLFYGYHNKILTAGGIYNPTEPVQLFKHHEQYRCNCGNPGLDKTTEVGLRIYKSTPVYFETQCVLTMIDRVLINC